MVSGDSASGQRDERNWLRLIRALRSQQPSSRVANHDLDDLDQRDFSQWTKDDQTSGRIGDNSTLAWILSLNHFSFLTH